MRQREIILYIRGRSFQCWRARRFLRQRGYHFEIVDTTDDPKLLIELSGRVHRKMMPPYIFVDHRPVGGLCVVRKLSRSGGPGSSPARPPVDDHMIHPARSLRCGSRAAVPESARMSRKETPR